MSDTNEGMVKVHWTFAAGADHLDRVQAETAELLEGADGEAAEKITSLQAWHGRELITLLEAGGRNEYTPHDFQAKLAALEDTVLNQAQELALTPYQRKIAAAAGMNLSDYAREYRKAVRHE